MFGKHIARLLFLLAFLCAAAVVLWLACNERLENTLLTRTQPEVLAEGWVVDTPDGAAPLAELSRTAAGRPDGTLRLCNTLPAVMSGNMSLCFQTKNETVRVWVGDTLVYAYGKAPQRVYGHGVGAIWNVAQLPEGAAGQPVAVELTPIGGRTGLAPYLFLLGTRGDVLSYLVKSRLAMIVICLLLALIGLTSLALFTVWAIRRNRHASAALYFGMFALLAAVWTISDSGMLQFVIPNKGVIYLLFGCSFYLFCAPLTMFMAVTLPKHYTLYVTYSIITSAYALLRIALYAAGLVDFEAALWLLHLMMAVVIVSINVTLWLPIIRNKRFEQPETTLAVTVFSLAEGISLISFYVHDKLDVLRNGYSSGFYVGIFLFVLITIGGVLRQAQTLRQQAFKAAFLEKRAYTDELTGLLNVKGFDDKCAELLRGLPEGGCCVLLDFDVNFFSQYNAMNGLDAGDALLKSIARAASERCGQGELCARQEADHFVCLLRGDSFDRVMERVREADEYARSRMAAKMLLLSFGLVEVTDRGTPVPSLRNAAAVAKRTVKGNYESNIAVYDRSLHATQMQEAVWLSGFEQSLQSNAYVIFLQPKIDAVTERVAGAEALVRRIEADGSVISAGPIIEALERKGFVTKLDYYVLGLVCSFQRRCLDEGRQVYPISSNFSRNHLFDPEFPSKVAATVDRYGISRRLAEIELTETAFLAGNDVLRVTVRRLRDEGFSVAIDDFGSGYSSLNMLKDVDVDVIKLDREFLSGFAENRRADTIISHTLHLAQEMRITAVAEGIETAEQLAFLRKLGCNLIQGYYFSRPLPEDVFKEKYLPMADSAQTPV